MKVVTDPSPLIDHATEAFYSAADDTLLDVANQAPWVTGAYSKGLKVYRRERPHGPTAAIGNRRVPYAMALEVGAFVRRGRGVHIQRARAPRPLQKGAVGFARHFERRLRSTPIRSSAIVSGEFGRELGTPFLNLAGEA